jgi:hypothetical protein
MNPVTAIRNRDPEALDAAFDSFAEAEEFRNEILPSLSPDDCRWFWQQVMEPEQLELTLSAVRDVCLAIAKELQLIPGKGYSLGYENGSPTMVLTQNCCQAFYERLPASRHSILRFYLQCVHPLESDELA